MVKSSL